MHLKGSDAPVAGAGNSLAAALEHPRFEVIPIRGVDAQAVYLPKGATTTVTCSPARGIDNMLEVAERLAGMGLRVVPHIAARLIVDRAHLREVLQRAEALGSGEIFVIGGDAREPVGIYPGALELLRAVADLEYEFDQVGIAAYPEHHPLIDDITIRRVLREKQVFATYLVTQICFDPAQIGRWLREARREGIHLPAYLGVPGAVDTARLLRISTRIGVGDSLRFLGQHTKIVARLLGQGSAGLLPEALRRGLRRRDSGNGVSSHGSTGYNPSRLLEGLAPYFADPDYGVEGIHINTFNAVDATEKWRRHMLRTIERTRS